MHCCLAAFYMEGFGYQENVLPRMHSLQGHKVKIVASTEKRTKRSTYCYVEPGTFVNEDGISVTRIPYAWWMPSKASAKLRVYAGLHEQIESFAPDVLFLHDCQFLSIRTVARYVKRFPKTIVFVDGHTDFGNSARTWSSYLLHRTVYRYCAKVIEPYATKFYGVLPCRVDFFEKVYGIARKKTELLVLGADDTLFDLEKRQEIRGHIREELGIAPDDFVLVTGGKIDRRKNIHKLMQVVSSLSRSDLKLIVFGEPDDEMSGMLDAAKEDESVTSMGWLAPEKVYDYLFAADLAVFPGTHSVLWEQSIGVGLPCVFRRWEGMDHVDLGGNCVFLDSSQSTELSNCILSLLDDRDRVRRMSSIAQSLGIPKFSYSEISKRAIADAI